MSIRSRVSQVPHLLERRTIAHQGAMLSKLALSAAIGMAVFTQAGGQTASATPTSCFSAIGVGISSNAGSAVRVGDSIDFSVEVFLSTASPADCPISNATLTLTLPNGVNQTLASGFSLAPGGSEVFDEGVLGFPLYKVSAADESPTTDRITASAAVTATATQSNPPGTDSANGNANTTILVIRPETMLTKSVNPTSGRTPLGVTYTFTETNDSPDTAADAAADDAITGSSIVITDSDSKCTPAPVLSGGFNVGDTNQNGLLDEGESWVYTCSETLTNTTALPKIYSDTATATGTAQDGIQAGTAASQGAPATETSNQAVVTVTNPATTLTETASVSTVRTGGSVTFTYKEKNTGSDALSAVTVTGSSCGAATFVSSSDTVTTRLDPGATWTFTCTETLTNTTTSPVTITDNVPPQARTMWTGTRHRLSLPAPR